MREIKFRAWDNKKKRWLTDYETCYLSEHGDVMCEIDRRYCDAEMSFVDATPVMYVNHKDSSGNEIYEGHIVRLNGDIHVVGFKGTGFWMVDPKDGSCWGFDDICTIEIIGNIYENPELLK